MGFSISRTHSLVGVDVHLGDEDVLHIESAEEKTVGGRVQQVPLVLPREDHLFQKNSLAEGVGMSHLKLFPGKEVEQGHD